ncbi:MAG: ABC transporter ATP-binding protein, partial [Corticimicrobacter sp.]|uniref:ABC transporter ATP-binding protein n=1 Tax=Corticimicrobacter sp. TaxID=2678536 RepID=UPI0032DA0959
MNATMVIEHAPVISVSGLSKHFGALEVLRDISLDVAQGEVIAVLGTSGCGKSTLLNILSGLLRPDAGHLRLYGREASGFTDWRRIVYMFQEDRLLPWRSIWRNVAFGLEAGTLSRTQRRERALAALAQVGLAAFAEAWPHQLSGGMRSRVALARSLVAEPGILLMDEPFSKLDPQTRSQMHAELLQLQRQHGMTVVFVTHDV